MGRAPAKRQQAHTLKKLMSGVEDLANLGIFPSDKKLRELGYLIVSIRIHTKEGIIEVVLFDVMGGQVRVGVNAPNDVAIFRSEIDPTLIKLSNCDATSQAAS